MVIININFVFVHSKHSLIYHAWLKYTYVSFQFYIMYSTYVRMYVAYEYSIILYQYACINM